ncbi:LysM peptidoglycan-binding domain-containing protein [Streptacidiphilus sp. N1-10]|uniref:LysM peptidoglycan-binding domain-containing protein n=1 Tax=Streptacidiphilus jeojiensis TaxID=3229225 RepID=A0ABV6XMV3_9ACTN
MLRLLLRGLTALVALALLLVGLPGVLALGTLAVTRQGDPTRSGIVDLLTQPDQGNLFLWALVVIGWLAWLCFALSVVVEIPAQLRGRSARRILALGWSQRMAGTLVGAVLALLPTAGAALAATPAAVTTTVGVHAPVAVTADQAAHARTDSGAAAATTTEAAKHRQTTYTVRDERPADSLWSIAESHLGSGARWHEIARLNQGRIMDAAGRRFDADRPIQPGWVLLMPADAVSAVTAPAPAKPGTEVKVEAGDSLSAIAQRELGNADEWPALFAANKGAKAPDGDRLEDPDLIEPGMVLTVPSTSGTTTTTTTPPTTTAPVTTPPTTTPPTSTAPVTTPPATAAPTHSAAPTHTAAPTPTATPTHPAHSGAAGASGPSTAPTSKAPTSAAPSTTASPSHTAGAPVVPPTEHGSTPTHGAGLSESEILSGTAVLAAVLVGAVALRRRNRAVRPAPRPGGRSAARPRSGGPDPVPLPPALLAPLPGTSSAPVTSEPDEDLDSGLSPVPAPLPELPAAAVATGLSAFETALTQRQDASGLDLLDRALRSLAATAVVEGRRLPALVAARLVSAQSTPVPSVELYLSAPAVPLAPFQAAHASTVWWTTPDAEGLLSPADAGTVPAPYPGLVSVGTMEDGSIVLVDLEAIRLVHLAGAPGDVADVLRTLALELAFTPLADRVNIHMVGVADELAAAAEGRLHMHATLEDAVAAVVARDLAVRQSLAEAGAATPREARGRGVVSEAWAPDIVLCPTAPSGSIPEALGRLLDASPRGSVAVVTAAPPPGAGPMARWTLPARGRADLPGLGMGVELQRLTDHQYAQWIALLRETGDGAGTRAGTEADTDMPDVDLDSWFRPDEAPAQAATEPEPEPQAQPQPAPTPLFPPPGQGRFPEPGASELAPPLDPWAVRSRSAHPGAVPAPYDPESDDSPEAVEAAHELILRRLRAGDHQGAEAAAFAGLQPAPDTELLHRDLLCVYADAGAVEQLNKAVTRLERLPNRTGRPLEPETNALIAELRGTG